MSKQLTGIVVSDVADKTVVVRVDSKKEHPLYRKKYTISKKFQVHDEKNEAKVGDMVTISETRPLSKTKYFTLSSIDRKAPEKAEKKA
jgi:small subunit ribosomal protein S17